MKSISFKIYFFVLFTAIMVGSAKPAQAVLPPNFIFDIGTQIFQIFSIIFIFISSALGILFIFLKKKFKKLRSNFKFNVLYIFLSVIIVLYFSFVTAFFYNEYKQTQEYKLWLLKTGDSSVSSELDKAFLSDRINVLFGNSDIDKFYSSDRFNSNIKYTETDKVIEFIYNYYINLSKGNYVFTYNISDKKIGLEEYKEYYSLVTKVEFNNIVRLDDSRSSFELTLYKNDQFEKYNTLLKLSLKEDGTPKAIEDIHSVLIERGNIVSQDFNDRDNIEEQTISINELEDITLNNKDKYLILDVREEFERLAMDINTDKSNLNILRVRMADLLMGRWLEISPERKVYVFCQDGEGRSKKVVEFLKSKNIEAFRIEEGAFDLNSLKSLGSYDFEKTAIKKNIKIMSTKEALKKSKDSNTFLVGSFPNIPELDYYITYRMTTYEISKAIDMIPENSDIILMCYSTLSCYFEEIFWLELEDRGHTVLGINNSLDSFSGGSCHQ